MLQDIVMPKLGLTMSEGTLARWIVPKGEPYKKGDPLFEAVTDKISFTVEATTDGTIVEIVIGEGETVPVGAVVARAEVGREGAVEAGRAGGAEAQRADRGPGVDQVPLGRHGRASGTDSESLATSSEAAVEIVRASPAAKKLAREHNIDLARVPGTGPCGRVVEGDVRAFLDRMLGAAADIIAKATGERGAGEAYGEQMETSLSGTTVPYTAIGKVSAERTSRSFRTAPHFYISMDVDAAALSAFRERAFGDACCDETGRAFRPSINDIIIKAVAMALTEHRYANASAADDGIVVYQEINIGVAVATDQGLMVPVVHDADSKTLLEIARETRRLASRARQGQLEPHDISGGTFTVSNLGMFGVDELCAVINPPQAAILGVGAVRQVPVVNGGAVVPGTVMRLTLSADHRVLDGASAAKFLGRVRGILESLEPGGTGGALG
ncbi:MAG: dihydrolipoamide acetyltransferase family protein [Betaproteobacteria bacterium]